MEGIIEESGLVSNNKCEDDDDDDTRDENSPDLITVVEVVSTSEPETSLRNRKLPQSLKFTEEQEVGSINSTSSCDDNLLLNCDISPRSAGLNVSGVSCPDDAESVELGPSHDHDNVNQHCGDNERSRHSYETGDFHTMSPTETEEAKSPNESPNSVDSKPEGSFTRRYIC